MYVFCRSLFAGKEMSVYLQNGIGFQLCLCQTSNSLVQRLDFVDIVILRV